MFCHHYKKQDKVNTLEFINCCYCSITKSCLTLCDPMPGLQHARLPCPLFSRVCSRSCSLSQWCHLTISSSVVPLSSRLQSFPASGSFPVSQFFTSGGQSIGASASASVFPVNIQGWFPLGLTSLISLQSKGLWNIFSSTIQKPQGSPHGDQRGLLPTGRNHIPIQAGSILPGSGRIRTTAPSWALSSLPLP